MDTDEYCRDIEAHLCRRNGGHLVRLVGPAFDMVRGWAAAGFRSRWRCRGSTAYVDRGPARRGRAAGRSGSSSARPMSSTPSTRGAGRSACSGRRGEGPPPRTGSPGGADGAGGRGGAADAAPRVAVDAPRPRHRPADGAAPAGLPPAWDAALDESCARSTPCTRRRGARGARRGSACSPTSRDSTRACWTRARARRRPDVVAAAAREADASSSRSAPAVAGRPTPPRTAVRDAPAAGARCSLPTLTVRVSDGRRADVAATS